MRLLRPALLRLRAALSRVLSQVLRQAPPARTGPDPRAGTQRVSDNAILCICVTVVVSAGMIATHSLEPLWLLVLLVLLF